MGMLSHIVLPQSKGAMDKPAKFADTAVPYMLTTLKSQGVDTKGLTAKIVGGSCMFGTGAFTQVGENTFRQSFRHWKPPGFPSLGETSKASAGVGFVLISARALFPWTVWGPITYHLREGYEL